MPTSSRKFGIEIEHYSGHPEWDGDLDGPTDSWLIRELEDEGIEMRPAGYMHDTTRWWKIVSDSSLNDNGMELVSPILGGDAGLQEVSTVLTHVKRGGGFVNHGCGLHVHVDARDFNLEHMKRLATFWIDWEDHFYLLVSPERRRNGYCEQIYSQPYPSSLRINTNNINPQRAYCLRITRERLLRQQRTDSLAERIAQAGSLDGIRAIGDLMNRHASLGFQSYWNNGSVEVRLHQGSLDTRVVRTWIKFCCSVLDLARSSQKLPIVARLQGKPAPKKYYQESMKRVLGVLAEYGAPEEALLGRTRRTLESPSRVL